MSRFTLRSGKSATLGLAGVSLIAAALLVLFLVARDPIDIWEAVDRRIAAEGRLTPQAALDTFATLYGPVPGARRLNARVPSLTTGTLAIRRVMRFWADYDTEQRKAITDRLEVPVVGEKGGRAGAHQRARSTRMGHSSFGSHM